MYRIPEGDESGLLTDEEIYRLNGADIDSRRHLFWESGVLSTCKITAKAQQALTTRLKDEEWWGKVREIFEDLNEEIGVYLDDNGVKKGYGLAYKALSKFRGLLKSRYLEGGE